jgi:hypothetical protein
VRPRGTLKYGMLGRELVFGIEIANCAGSSGAVQGMRVTKRLGEERQNEPGL